eukprot:355531-Chlamydomonas_euryale.AAC.4
MLGQVAGHSAGRASEATHTCGHSQACMRRPPRNPRCSRSLTSNQLPKQEHPLNQDLPPPPPDVLARSRSLNTHAQIVRCVPWPPPHQPRRSPAGLLISRAPNQLRPSPAAPLVSRAPHQPGPSPAAPLTSRAPDQPGPSPAALLTSTILSTDILARNRRFNTYLQI